MPIAGREEVTRGISRSFLLGACHPYSRMKQNCFPETASHVQIEVRSRPIWMNAYGMLQKRSEREKERRRETQLFNKRQQRVLMRFTCYRISKPQLATLFSVQTHVAVCSCLIIDVILVAATVHCANYHHDCLTMRKNATLPSRHRLCCVFRNESSFKQNNS